MLRGELWTVAGGGDYVACPEERRGGPRPVVIVQDERFAATDSITICALTTDPTEAPLFRVELEPSEENGLDAVSRIMVDKVTTVRKSRLGTRIGELADEDVIRLNRALAVFLGLASAPPRRSTE